MVQDISNRIGTFVESDANNFNGLWRDYMRVRVLIDVEAPLKRKMNLKGQGNQMCCVQFKYEGLTTFCFVCGRLGHSERFCDKIFDTPLVLIPKPYGPGMKAPSRGRTHTMGARWPRQGVTYKSGGGEAAATPPAAGTSMNQNVQEGVNSQLPISETAVMVPTDRGIMGDISGRKVPTIIGADIVHDNLHQPAESMHNNESNENELAVVISEAKRKRDDLGIGPSKYGPPEVGSDFTQGNGLSHETLTKGKSLLINAEAQVQQLGSGNLVDPKNLFGAGSGSQTRRAL